MFRKIVIPLDGSESAENALQVALGIAGQEAIEPIFVRATPIVPTASVGSPDMLTDYNYLETQELTTTFHEQTTDYLNEMAERYAERLPNLRTIAELGEPAVVIVEIAEQEHADLIVMSTHGHSGLTHFMLGSVTERVLHAAPCPVLAVRSDKPLENIMITLDGSALSEMALEPGIDVARHLGSKVTLLQVVEKLDQNVAGYLNGLAARYADSDVVVETKLLHGSPVTQILDHIQTNEVDLAVMSTHGRSGIKRWLYGSVSEKVLRHAPCAVMIVRPE
jgi:nucleotide-binding universal stress UspA family protein